MGSPAHTGAIGCMGSVKSILMLCTSSQGCENTVRNSQINIRSIVYKGVNKEKLMLPGCQLRGQQSVMYIVS